MELTRGTIADRPWAQTLSALSRRGFTGQLALVGDDGKQFAIAFERGMAVGATSPLSNDLIVRIALTNHFISAGQVAQLARTIAAAPQRDEIDIIVEASKLTAEQEILLRERAILQRAARTFSVDTGTFILDDQITIQTSPCVVDPLRIIYFGVRMNLSEQRLLDDLRYMGTFFEVGPKAQDELMRYGFGKDEQPILEAVRSSGTSVPALEVSHRELDPRTVQAVLFTLAACGTAVGSTPSNLEMPTPPARFAASSSPAVQRIQSSSPLVVKATADQIAVARTPSSQASDEWRSMGTPGTARTGIGLRAAPAPAPAKTPPRPGGTSPPPSESGNRTTVSPPSEPGTPSSEPAGRTARTTAPPPTGPGSESGMRANPLLASPRTTTASRLGPLPAPPLPGEEPIDLELDFAAEITAGPPPVEDPKAAALAAFKRGEAAIGSEQLDIAIAELTRATQLQPDEHDYSSMLAWARFCAAKDKAAVADATRKVFVHVILKVEEPVLAEFLLGRVERMLGRDREALAHFRRVLELRPRHGGAAAEIRVIELRLGSPKPGGSLFGRK